jgi:hypothetical protein
LPEVPAPVPINRAVRLDSTEIKTKMAPGVVAYLIHAACQRAGHSKAQVAKVRAVVFRFSNAVALRLHAIPPAPATPRALYCRRARNTVAVVAFTLRRQPVARHFGFACGGWVFFSSSRVGAACRRSRVYTAAHAGALGW